MSAVTSLAITAKFSATDSKTSSIKAGWASGEWEEMAAFVCTAIFEDESAVWYLHSHTFKERIWTCEILILYPMSYVF